MQKCVSNFVEIWVLSWSSANFGSKLRISTATLTTRNFYQVSGTTPPAFLRGATFNFFPPGAYLRYACGGGWSDKISRRRRITREIANRASENKYDEMIPK